LDSEGEAEKEVVAVGNADTLSRVGVHLSLTVVV